MIRRWVMMILLIMTIGINLDCSQPEILTWKVVKKDLTHGITVDGVIEACNVNSLSSSLVALDCAIIRLVPEGSRVNPGDTICVFDNSLIMKDLDKARLILDSCRLDYQSLLDNQKMKEMDLQSKIESELADRQNLALTSQILDMISPSQEKKDKLNQQKNDILLQRLQNQLVNLRQVNQAELGQQKAKIAKAEKSIERLMQNLDKLVLISPVSGLILIKDNPVTGKKFSLGDRIMYPGPIMEIPDLSDFYAVAHLDEFQIREIKVDQSIEVTLPGSHLNPIPGRVISVATVGEPIREGSTVKRFTVKGLLTRNDSSLQVGITAQIRFRIDSLSDTLFIPQECVFEMADKKIVYLQQGKKYCPQPVSLGRQSRDWVIVADGIAAGDVIALNKPPDRLIIRPTEDSL
ncbi:MAG: hypothetical protein KBA26_10895 [Candidatus Delongbacteria bacterium]|nr:hypothetical protein [Candidatus Delongbacteria bacterium]